MPGNSTFCKQDCTLASRCTASPKPGSMRSSSRGCILAAIVVLVTSVQFSSVLGDAQALQLSKALYTEDGKHGVYEVLHGVPKWRLLPFLWIQKVVKLSWTKVKVCTSRRCPEGTVWLAAYTWHRSWPASSLLQLGTDIHLCYMGAQDPHAYAATGLEQLQQKVQKGESQWCGLSRFFGRSDRECVLTVSPFGETYIALALQHPHTSPGKLSLNASALAPLLACLRCRSAAEPCGQLFFSKASRMQLRSNTSRLQYDLVPLCRFRGGSTGRGEVLPTAACTRHPGRCALLVCWSAQPLAVLPPRHRLPRLHAALRPHPHLCPVQVGIPLLA